VRPRKQGRAGCCLFQLATWAAALPKRAVVVACFWFWFWFCFTACPRDGLTWSRIECVGLFLDVERWDPSEVHWHQFRFLINGESLPAHLSALVVRYNSVTHAVIAKAAQNQISVEYTSGHYLK
jgi:hypothetical protein